MTTRLEPPGPLPPPRPADFLSLPAGSMVGRMYFRDGSHPSRWDSFRTFGPVSRMRFDHHPNRRGEHPDYAIVYASPSVGRHGPLDPFAAGVLECFGTTGVIDRRAKEPWFAMWSFAEPIRLLDVVDAPWITRAHGNAAISSGPRSVCRAWSRAIHRTYTNAHGIYYETSSLPMMRSIALFERTIPLMPTRPRVNLPLTHPGLEPALRRIATTYGMDLIP